MDSVVSAEKSEYNIQYRSKTPARRSLSLYNNPICGFDVEWLEQSYKGVP